MTTKVTHAAPPTAADPEDAARTQRMHRAFETHYTSAYPRICRIVRNHGLSDEDDVLGDISEHLWRQFPARYREEQADLAAGRPSRHKWVSLFCEIARNKMIDRLRAEGLARRKRRGQVSPPADDESTGQARTSNPRRREVPLLFAERLVAPPESDPAVSFEQREESAARSYLPSDQRILLQQALAYLESVEPDQFNALQTLLHNIPDEEACSLLQTDRFTIYRRRRAARRTLRHFYAQRGLKFPTTKSPSRHHTSRAFAHGPSSFPGIVMVAPTAQTQ